MRPILPKPAERFRATAIFAALLFGGVLDGPPSAYAEPRSDQMSDAISKTSREAFELLTAPRTAAADLTIKIVGDQGHWSYTYTNPLGPTFKSSANAATGGQPDMDADIVLPQGKVRRTSRYCERYRFMIWPYENLVFR